jgi:DNA polymerase-1
MTQAETSVAVVTFEQARAALGAGSLALDLETYAVDKARSDEALDPACGEVRLVSLCAEGGSPLVIDHLRTPIPPEGLARFLSGRELIIHNSRFDQAWLEAKFGIQLAHERIFDTLLAEQILTNGLGVTNSLGPALERELGLHLPKEHGRDDWGELFLTSDQLAYAADDVAHLHRLKAHQLKRLEGEGLIDTYLLEIADLLVVEHLQRAGFAVDRTVLLEVQSASGKEACVRANRVREALGVGKDFNINSPSQLLPALREKGIVLPGTGEELLAARSEPVCRLILDYREIEMERRQAAALLGHITPEGRIHAQFNPMGARTGRFSSSDPNLQQVTRRGLMRKAFVAAPGSSLIILDFSQIELRAAALLSGDKAMLDAFMRGEDLHKQTASVVLQKPIKDVTNEDRQTAKAVNFGLIFGQQAAGLVEYARAKYGVILSLEQAEKIRRKFFKHYIGLAAWHRLAWLRAPFVLEGRTSPLNRRRLPQPGASDWDKFQLKVNFPVQGSMADGLKRALIRLLREASDGVRLVNCVHDEAILEAPTKVAEEVRQWAHRVMVEEMAEILPGMPVEVESRVCANWGQKT